MSNENRRQFLKNMAKAGCIGLMSLIPGSIFSAKTVIAESKKWDPQIRPKPMKSQFETALSKATKSNLKLVLQGTKLSQEEKLAVVALKELNAKELQGVISGKIGQAANGGDVCGVGCGSDCGGTCGISCSIGRGAEAVINPAGKLGINLRGFNKTKFKQLLLKGQKMQRGL